MSPRHTLMENPYRRRRRWEDRGGFAEGGEYTAYPRREGEARRAGWGSRYNRGYGRRTGWDREPYGPMVDREDEWEYERGFEDVGWSNFPDEYEGEPGPYSGIGPRNYQARDEDIYDLVCSRLTQHGQIDASEMEVHVQEREVTLRGTVANRSMKRLAEDVADSVPGVRDVHNQLRLSGQPGGGAGRREEVGESGVYPASGPPPEGDAEVHGMASWGQGERGAEGYEDHGDSEIRPSP
jgi:hypothetical protein